MKDHIRLSEKKKSTEKIDKARKVGCGSEIKIQKKLIDIISKEIVAEIVGLIYDCIKYFKY